MKTTRLLQIACLATVCATSGAAMARPAQAVASNFEMSKFVGTWHEIARFRDLTELTCQNVTATYTPSVDVAGVYHVANKCDRLGGIPSRRHGSLFAPDAQDAARMVIEVRHAGVATSHTAFNVLAVDEDYQWALVGEPELRSLWILSRTPFINVDVLQTLAQRASQEFGYENVEARLHCTKQPFGANKACEDVLR